MQERECRNCGAVFDHRHGNARHCSKECSDEARRARSRMRHAEMKPYQALYRNDQILKAFHMAGEEIVSRKLLYRSGFDENAHFKETGSTDNPIMIMGQYGAKRISKHEFKIYRITNGDN